MEIKAGLGGGYCSKCDTVWAEPGTCKCACTFDSSDKNLGQTEKGYVLARDSVYAKEVWNEAIEAAAVKAKLAIGFERESSLGSHVSYEIRKLKK